jgi:hypothetical protein
MRRFFTSLLIALSPACGGLPPGTDVGVHVDAKDAESEVVVDVDLSTAEDE